MSFTIGCDPEFFLKLNNKHVSAVGLIGGSKDFPRPLEKDGFAILEDNVSVEFNVAPAHNHEEFIQNIQYVMSNLKGLLPEYEFSRDAAVVFNPEDLAHPQAQEFGCEPDFNAWTRKINPRPKAPDQNLRSAGGHVHIGHENTLDPIEVIRAMDVFAGVPATKLDQDVRRRQLYGKAGCHRIKNYGCEYRTLSNFWIFEPTLIKWVFEQTQKAVQFVKDGHRVNEDHAAAIQACINDNDGNAYEYIVQTYGLAR